MSKVSASNTWNDLPKIARNAIVIGGLAVLIIATVLIVKKIKEKAELIKVPVNKSNIPQYSRKQLVEFRDVCCNGDKPKSGRAQVCEVNDPKRVGCAWVPKVLEWMDKNKTNTLYMWHPQLMAKRLHEEMNGIKWSDVGFAALKYATLGLGAYFWPANSDKDYSSREGLYRNIAKLNPDQVRWLHNWWSDHHADGANLYAWIDGESGVSRDIRNQAMAAMDRAGVGSNIISSREKTG